MYNSGIGTPYWFEWEIGILECLNMLQDTSIESVILQSTDFQALDDVVVNYSDKSILNIQVKHTDEDTNGKQASYQRYADVYVGQMLWAFLTQDS